MIENARAGSAVPAAEGMNRVRRVSGSVDTRLYLDPRHIPHPQPHRCLPRSSPSRRSTRPTSRSTSIASSSRPRPLARREHKVIAVLPAYNAERDARRHHRRLPAGLRGRDPARGRRQHGPHRRDRPRDGPDGHRPREEHAATAATRRRATATALDHGADVVVMIHPDYQYDARVIPHAVGIIELGICDVVLGNRVRSRGRGADVRHAVVEVRRATAG